ncbi:MAG TPA: ABC transporter permease [Opitutaceae bacterium]|nr:ABC transporter permease [Opitutaceae bacterium]
MHTLWSALRHVRRSPGFTALAVVTLGLGIGSSTAIFTVTRAVLFRPPSYQEPEQLVRLWVNDPARGFVRGRMSHTRFQLIRAQQREIFAGLAANCPVFVTVSGPAGAEQVAGQIVSADFFPVLGVRLRHGRTFRAAEDRPDGDPVVIVTHGFWHRRFGGDPAALGRTLTVNGRPHTLIGVLPEDFTYPYGAAELWLTNTAEPPMYNAQQVRDGAAYLNATGRAAPGISLAALQAEIRRLDEAYHDDRPDRVDATGVVEAITFQEELVGQQRAALYLLFGAVALVHLIACTNIANLLLARFSARARETALRAALGASPRALVWRFASESLVLALLAGALGIVLAAAQVRLFAGFVSSGLPAPVEARPDGAVLAFTIGLSVLTGLATGLYPAFHATRRDLVALLREATHGPSATRRAGAFRRALLVGEVAIALVLLVVTALVTVSFWKLRRIDPGMRREGALVAQIELPQAAYATPEQQARFGRGLVERTALLPGVRRAALTDTPPLGGNGVFSPYAAEGRPLPPMEQRLAALRQVVSPGCLPALGIPLLAGRDFADTDDGSRPTVAILSASAARALFGAENPLGRKIILGVTQRTAEVIGVAGDVRMETFDHPATPSVYFCLWQRARPSLAIVAETTEPPEMLAPSLRAVLRELDPEIPLVRVRPLADIFRDAMADRRLPLALLSIFAGSALLLAGLGIYSVTVYGVWHRAPEISVRLVLGASPGSLTRLLVRDGARPIAAGLALGLALSAWFARIFERLLFETRPVNPAAYAAVAAFVGLAALLACWLAARQVTRIDPLRTLRAD